MKKLFLIIGAPGSGKTTNAELIAKKYENITHYSTGDMLRAEVATKSETGKEIENYINNGLIVPINIAIKTIINAIKNAPTNNIIIDGYPRSLEQLNALDEYLKIEDELELKACIEVVVSQNTAKDRVLGRNRGDDDKIEVFNNRMNVYLEPLKAIQDFYEEKKLLKKIDGERTIEKIVEDIDSFIKSKI
ncbi:adenylate kinase [Aliarcobacter trophiarum LMG 25534]|uniref:Adenylate kinase n=1 Tax=Aliarcobacter trophiarum LMG 25534 TaxID=1032241 RepID=A0AAD0QJM5_9BACT|nr:adenylate kinase [Aliarcobacter trophiarum]AXK48651.1 adenylate kinase [Aliarcobacter trophiarum LMG 25534]RXI27387.1 adenylate kinase [Aliarcobacter trophiarum]RXJ91018.1 adenylate kinase [Aliarcobacter trophiarum LMG 25534]